MSGSLALATPHRLATEAGVAAFRAGGTAIDAALAAAATLTVVAPQDCAVGGDAVALVGRPDGSVRVVNGSGAAAFEVDASALRASHRKMPVRGVDSVTVPGAVAAWGSISALGGRLPWADLLAAAVVHAAEGVPVSAPLARALKANTDLIAADVGLRGVFAPAGVPLRAGAHLRQPVLARTLQELAAAGPKALYEGEIGESLVDGLRALGSALRREDLVANATELTAPLRRRYAGLEVATAPPNSQGFVLLEVLGAIEALGPPPDPLGPDSLLLAELCRRAARDRDQLLADPRHRRTPVEELLGAANSAALAEAARRSLRAEEGTGGGSAKPSGGDTVAIAALDDGGNSVSLIQSVFWSFGAGILEPRTGILCHNRGAGFSLEPGAPGGVLGGVRPPHTLMPVLVLDEDGVSGAHGTMGGPAQPQIHLQLLLHLLRGASAAEAVAARRWVVDDAGGLLAERGAGADVERDAEAILAGGTDEVGHAQLARRVAAGGFEVGSDPRADPLGAAIIRR